MKKSLVAYFSASRVTAAVAKRLAALTQSDLFEIKPITPYSAADLDWTNPKCRSSVEMNDKSFRPPVSERLPDMEQYDLVFVGFPIWWYVAPTIINSFLEQYSFAGKTVIPFATSGSSGMGRTNDELKSSCKGATLREGKRFDSKVSDAELKLWAKQQLAAQ